MPITMKLRPIVMYLGGFAKVGGIEAFARDFLLAIAPDYPSRELVMWGRHGKDHRLLNEIADSGARISASPWRWGCGWNLPDYVLVPAGLNAIRQAATVIFKRPPPRPILGFLRRSAQRNGRPIPFILIMPYRPLEYWGTSPDPAEYEYFDIIVVQSEDGVRDLKKMGYRGRIENIPYLPPKSLAPASFPSTSGDRIVRLGFLGRMVEQKNLDYLLEIYRVLTQEGNKQTHYELHLFGDGDERKELERRSVDLGLSGVFFHGETPREEVIGVIDSCDLFLNTSTTEGQCLVALEVLSRGRPLVATAVGALPEVLRQRELGRLAPLGKAEAFAALLLEVVDAIRNGQMTPDSIVTAFRARYDYDSILKRYLALLADVAGK
jgi:glycosyltransferase involved in cell wall biosynthesis